MAKFIELHFNSKVADCKMINIDSISYIDCNYDGGASIYLKGSGEVLHPSETYKEIESIIRDLVL